MDFNNLNYNKTGNDACMLLHFVGQSKAISNQVLTFYEKKELFLQKDNKSSDKKIEVQLQNIIIIDHCESQIDCSNR